MRGYWTNLILHTSASIYNRKTKISSSNASKSIFDVFAIIFLELFLSAISFPLYLVSKGESTGGKAQFKIRKIFTLSFLLVILAVWLAKLILMVGLPIYFDNRQFLITTEDSGNGQAIEQSYLLPAAYNAKTDTLIAAPVIENLSKTNGNGLSVNGIGEADTKIIVNIGREFNGAAPEENNIKSFIVNTDKTGNWRLETDVKSFNLQPGKYWMQAIAYDSETGKKSEVSPAKYFEINQNVYDRLIGKADKYLNYFMVAFIALGIFSIIILL